jgi:hypothetical protein
MCGIEDTWSFAMGVISDVPLFWPAAVLALACAAGLAGVTARLVDTSAWSAFLLFGSLGVILAATVTPSVAAFVPVDRDGGCVLHQFALPAFSKLLYPNETSLNVVLFMPLGLACGLMRRWSLVSLTAVLAAGLPFAIEIAQYAVPSLGRVCSTADVADNLSGLAAGLLVGIAILRPIGSVAAIDAVGRGPR